MKYKNTVRIKRTVSFAAAVAMAVSAVPIMPAYAETGTKSYVYDKYKVDYTVNSEWFGKQNVSVTLTNTSDEPILNWALGYDAQGDIDGIWNGYVSNQNGEDYIIKNMGYNYEIAPYQSITYGYVLSTSDYVEPDFFNLCSKRVDKASGYDVKLNVTGDWGEGFQGEIVLTNTSDAPIEAWELSFDTNFVINNLWGGKILNAENNSYTLASEMWTNPIAPGTSVTIGFVGSKDASVKPVLSGTSVSEVVIDGTTSAGEEEEIPDISITANAVYSEENANIVLSWNTNVEKGSFDVLYSTDNVEYNSAGTVKNAHSYVMPANELTGTVYFKVIQTVKDRIGESAIVSVDIPVPVVKVTPEITLSAEYNAETGYIDVLWNSTVADGSFDILTSYNDGEYESAAVVSETSSYSFAPENAGEYSIKTVQTTSVGVTGESNAVKVTVPEDEEKEEPEPIVDPDIDWSDSTDTDGDGISDVYEKNYLKTDPKKSDTDGDGISDGYEMFYLWTEPLKADSDDNGVSDADEDFDEDGLSNLKEYELGTNPKSADTDNDGLSDKDEVEKYSTDPLKYDTDEDGISDGDEIALGTDPKSALTNGVLDSERVFEQHIDKNSDIFSKINTSENPFDVSIDITSAGVAENNLRSMVSGYSKAISNDAVVGVAPEFIYTDGLKVDDVVINFDLDNNIVNNTNGKYADVSDEFAGIKRLNVFKFFEDTNTLLPIETFHDEANNRVYTHVDELGTYCLIDMEIWLDSIEFEYSNTQSARVSASAASSNSNDDDPDDSPSNSKSDYIDVVMIIYPESSLIDKTKDELRTTCQRLYTQAEKKNKTLRVYFVSFLGESINAPSGRMYSSSYEEAEYIIDKYPRVTTALAKSDYALHKALNYTKNNCISSFVRNSDRYCFVIDVCGYPTVYTGIGAVGTLKENEVRICFSYNPGNTNEQMYYLYSTDMACEKAVVGSGVYNFSDFVYNEVFGDHGKHIIIKSTGLARLPDDFDDITKDSIYDYDADGIDDIEEINCNLVSFMSDGTISYPTFNKIFESYSNLFYVKCGLERLNKVTNGELYNYLGNIHIMPIYSDPTEEDSDLDDIDDLTELFTETNRLDHDTDNDGLLDGIEVALWFDPLNPDPDGDGRLDLQEYLEDTDPFLYNKSWDEHIVDFLKGFFAGDFINESDSYGVVIGQITSSFIPMIDIRDALGNLYNGDYKMAGLSVLGLIPDIGDAAKASGKIGKFITKNLDNVPMITGILEFTEKNFPSISKELSKSDEAIEVLKHIDQDDTAKYTRKSIDAAKSIIKHSDEAEEIFNISKKVNFKTTLDAEELHGAWKLGWWKRGNLFDDFLNEHNLGKNGKGLGRTFPVFDRIEDGKVISTKSVDLGLDRLKDKDNLKEYLNSLSDPIKKFEKKYLDDRGRDDLVRHWKSKNNMPAYVTTVHRDDLKNKALEIVLPEVNISDEVADVLNKFVVEAKKEGIEVWYILSKG